MGIDLALLLPFIVRNPDLHAKLLNTFSYLEYIGFRKIVKSQIAERLDPETLSHALEEGRHALLLKKLAIKTGGGKFEMYSPASLLRGPEAEIYFQSLDRACERIIEAEIFSKNKVRLTYLYVTWLVEQRALAVYECYQETLGVFGIKPPLNGLLAEEDKHLADVERELLDSDTKFSFRVAALKEVEETLYQTYLLALSQQLKVSEKFVEAHV